MKVIGYYFTPSLGFLSTPVCGDAAIRADTRDGTRCGTVSLEWKNAERFCMTESCLGSTKALLCSNCMVIFMDESIQDLC
jgi:hypothetical protein